MFSISFYNADVKKVIADKRVLKQFIPTLFTNEGKKLLSLSIIFCTDEYLLSLNKQFLSHDYLTDILTFDLSQSDEIDGEIYISVDRVKENSVIHGVSFQNEIKRIVFHGSLHLCGFMDKTPVEKEIMTQKENEYLELYGTFHVKQKK